MSYNTEYNVYVDITSNPSTNSMCDCHHDIQCGKCMGDGMCINCRDHIFPKWMKERCFTWWISTNRFLNDDRVIWPGVDISTIKKFDLIKVSKQVKDRPHVKKATSIR